MNIKLLANSEQSTENFFLANKIYIVDKNLLEHLLPSLKNTSNNFENEKNVLVQSSEHYNIVFTADTAQPAGHAEQSTITTISGINATEKNNQAYFESGDACNSKAIDDKQNFSFPRYENPSCTAWTSENMWPI